MDKRKDVDREKKETKPSASWTDGKADMLVFMMEYKDASKFFGQNGWTKEGWNCMEACLNKQYPRTNFTVKQVKDRQQQLKRDYAIVKSILEKSGFGWDPDKKWDELIQEQRKWRFKEFPYYDDLHGIWKVC
ncbi:unnamed protein product [Alopecurus aequalis]